MMTVMMMTMMMMMMMRMRIKMMMVMMMMMIRMVMIRIRMVIMMMRIRMVMVIMVSMMITMMMIILPLTVSKESIVTITLLAFPWIVSKLNQNILSNINIRDFPQVWEMSNMNDSSPHSIVWNKKISKMVIIEFITFCHERSISFQEDPGNKKITEGTVATKLAMSSLPSCSDHSDHH